MVEQVDDFINVVSIFFIQSWGRSVKIFSKSSKILANGYSRIYAAEPVPSEAFSRCGLLPEVKFLGFSPRIQHFKGKSSIWT